MTDQKCDYKADASGELPAPKVLTGKLMFGSSVGEPNAQTQWEFYFLASWHQPAEPHPERKQASSVRESFLSSFQITAFLKM